MIFLALSNENGQIFLSHSVQYLIYIIYVWYRLKVVLCFQ